MNEGLRSIMPASDQVCEAPKECYVDTLVGNLLRKQTRAQRELDTVTEALQALQANPEIAKVLELVSKASR